MILTGIFFLIYTVFERDELWALTVYTVCFVAMIVVGDTLLSFSILLFFIFDTIRDLVQDYAKVDS